MPPTALHRLRPSSAGTPRAFTLIELIVVIVVLGVLAALAVPAFTASQRRAQEGTLDTTLQSVWRNAKNLAAPDNQRDPRPYLTRAAEETAGSAGTLSVGADPAAGALSAHRNGTWRYLTVPGDGSAPVATSAAPGTYAHYRGVVLASGPSGYWPLDAATGAVQPDESGRGFPATPGRSDTAQLLPSQTAPLVAGSIGALQFHGGSSNLGSWLLASPSSPAVLTQASTNASWSLEAWVRPANYPTGAEALILGRHGFHAGLQQHATGGVQYLRAIVTTDDATNGFLGSASVHFPITDFTAVHHLVAIWENRTLTLYVNGARIGTSTLGSGYQIRNLGNPMALGSVGANWDTRYRFRGQADELASHDRALTASEVQAHYTAGRP